MTTVLDDPIAPLTWIAMCGIGYLIGMIFPGYAAVFFWLKAQARAWGALLSNIAIVLHLALSLSALFALAIVLHRLKVQGALNSSGAPVLAMVLAILFPLVIGMTASRDFERWSRE